MKKLLLAGIALALAWGIFRPLPPPDPFPGSDKLAHLLGFLALALAARQALPRARPGWLWGLLLLAGPLLEWLQHWVSPLRERSLGDALANVAGALLAWGVWRLWIYRRRRPPAGGG